MYHAVLKRNVQRQGEIAAEEGRDRGDNPYLGWPYEDWWYEGYDRWSSTDDPARSAHGDPG